MCAKAGGCGIGKGRARSIHDVIPKLAQSKKVGVIVFVQMLFVYLPMAGGCLVCRVCCLFLRTRAARIAETFNVKNMGTSVNIRRILLSVIFVVVGSRGCGAGLGTASNT